MPRKTDVLRGISRSGSSSFNEAAARCRGKPWMLAEVNGRMERLQ